MENPTNKRADANAVPTLRNHWIITSEPEQSDGRRVNYRLTEKGIGLAPVLLELLIWGARHEETWAPCAVIAKMAENRDQLLGIVRQRWEERDPTPVLPWLSGGRVNHHSARARTKK